MPPPNLSTLPGFDRATDIWRLWKAGQSAPGATAATEVLFASSCAAMDIAPPVGAGQPDELIVQFLTTARPQVLAWLQQKLGVEPGHPIRLYRGIRHQDAEDVRIQLGLGRPYVLRPNELLSFSCDAGVAVGFARKSIRALKGAVQHPGLVFFVDVQQDEIVTAENAGMCPDLAAEDEVAVILRTPRAVSAAEIPQDNIPVGARLH